jgi:hypothetical protein
MQTGVSVLERAFQLAATGHFANVWLIKRQLDLEGYASLQVSGPMLCKRSGGDFRPSRGNQTATSATRLLSNCRLRGPASIHSVQ